MTALPMILSVGFWASGWVFANRGGSASPAVAALEARLAALEERLAGADRAESGAFARLFSFNSPYAWPVIGSLLLVGLALARRWGRAAHGSTSFRGRTP